MTSAPARSKLFRARSAHGHHRVTYVELFFDLVFVFAITQLSHGLLGNLTAMGGVELGLLLVAVWWVWIYTSWITNWLDPDQPPVRIMLLCLMLAGLGLSTSLPHAFAEQGRVFALSYVLMQVGRTTFMFLSLPRGDALKQTFARILSWFVASSLLWLAGMSAPHDTRLWLWAAALGLELCGPMVRYYTPGLGSSRVEEWNVEGGHLSERCALFIIIALGESVLVAGATFCNQAWGTDSVLAFATAFTGTIAMWWIYFDRSVELGSARITSAADPGRLGRLAYTYLHLPIVAGIILSAVGDELLLAHPHEPPHTSTIVTIVGGPLLYVAGAVLFKHTIRGWFQLSHLVGIALLGGVGLVGSWLSTLTLAAVVTGVLLLVAMWESVSLSRSSLEAALRARH